MPDRLYGCIEAGGTKFIVGVVRSHGEIVKSVRIDTTVPEETIGASIAALKDMQARNGNLAAIGIASFGPAELDRSAPNWGHITTTPKPHWANTNFAGRIARELGVPVGFDTDVNGAGLAEARWGAGFGHKAIVYITVGTGIGGGAIVEGKPLFGQSHPEMGHMRVPRHPDDHSFAGTCPFHGDCIEGLASGPAIMARWGQSLSDLPADHPGHSIIAWYLGQLVTVLQAMLEPGRIIFGGGVLSTPGLLDRVKLQADQLGGGYFHSKPHEILVRPALGDRAGLLGGLALALDIAGVQN